MAPLSNFATQKRRFSTDLALFRLDIHGIHSTGNLLLESRDYAPYAFIKPPLLRISPIGQIYADDGLHKVDYLNIETPRSMHVKV